MIKSRVTQVVYRSIYVAILTIGVFCSLGLFDKSFNNTFFVYYTNLSNYICLGIMIAELVFTIKALNRNEMYGTESPLSRVKFLAAVWILITFAIYNVLLGDITSIEYWTSLSNLILHVFGPLLFIFDYLLFTKKKKVKWIDCLWVLSFPYVYIAFIFIRAAIIGVNANTVIYPYFFFDVGKYGVGGVTLWITGLSAIFIVLAFGFCFQNRYQKTKILNSDSQE